MCLPPAVQLYVNVPPCSEEAGINDGKAFLFGTVQLQMNYVPTLKAVYLKKLLGASERFQTAVSLRSAGTGVGTTHLSPE